MATKDKHVTISPEQLAALKVDLAASVGEAHAKQIMNLADELGAKIEGLDLTELASGVAAASVAITDAARMIGEFGARMEASLAASASAHERMESALAENVSAQERPLTIVQVGAALKASPRQVFCVLASAGIGSVKLLAGTKISNQGHNIIDLARAGLRLKLEV